MLATATHPHETATSEVSHDTDTEVFTAMRQRPGATHEHAALLQRVTQLRGALRAAADDNARLQRKLARARAENRRLRQELAQQPDRRPVDGEYVRRALTEPWSRNP